MPCPFPAAELLQMRRMISKNMPPRSDMPTPITWAMGDDLIAMIDATWQHHQQTTGCQCWQEARSRAAQGIPSAHPAAPAEPTKAPAPPNAPHVPA